MNVYLVRHAQSENNARDESERVCDPSITEIGQQQAICLADGVGDWEFERLISSAFRRALQTAAAIRRVRQLVPEVVIDFHEHGGCFDGYTESTFQGRPGLDREGILNEFGQVNVPEVLNGAGWWRSQKREDYDQTQERARRINRYLVTEAQADGRPMLCVTHADFLAVLLCEMLGPDIKTDARFQDIRNTSVTRLEWSGEWKLHDLNSVVHLPEDLITS